MRSRKYSTALIRLLATVVPLLALAAGTPAVSQSEFVLHNFHLVDGALPGGALIADARQNLYGTTYVGGSGNCAYNGPPSGCGTVYKLTHSPEGRWTETVLYAFQGGSDGEFPFSGLILDQAGNLYGTTPDGGGLGQVCGLDGCGTVFELSPPSQPGGSWTETVLYRFTGGADQGYPRGTLIFDSKGNLYGVTDVGGYGMNGTVFQLIPPSTPGGDWTETTLYAFGSHYRDGLYPVAGLAFDESGNLYGTTGGGGNKGCGTVFQLKPPATSGEWTEKVVHAFQGGTDGSGPTGGLILVRGALMSTTENGGQYDQGTVFQITPSGGGVSESVVYSFQGGNDGAGPYAGLIADSELNLYGTTIGGGALGLEYCTNYPGCGTVFQLTPPAVPGSAWTEKVLYAFSGGNDGGSPDGSLVLGDGWLLGTASEGGSSQVCDIDGIHGCGVVFAIHK
ncbi:MAG TPA: choice-of-anchor tandem repeat GloVer-containing protein [Terriglobales bacterium]|nr:choice-of-anchor tandem repeat GloVer-containing protein [Terriglobales bacterium]